MNPIPRPFEGPGRPAPGPIEYNEFEKLPVAKPRAIIDGLLDDSSRMVFGGGSKTYKTWAMSDLALSVACGARWWGFGTYQCGVLYVNWELKEYYCKSRFHSIRMAKCLNIPRDFFWIWNLRNVSLKLKEFQDSLIGFIQRNGVLLVVIDPFYKLLEERDERISAELVPILRLFEEINLLTSATVICSAHYTKGNQASKDPMDRISGGSNLNRHPDCLLTMTNHKEPHAFSVEFIHRDFPPTCPFVVRWNHPLLEKADDLNPAHLKIPSPGRPSIYHENQILEILKEHDDELIVTELQKMVSEETGMSRAKFYEFLSALQKEKKIFKSIATGFLNLKA